MTKKFNPFISFINSDDGNGKGNGEGSVITNISKPLNTTKITKTTTRDDILSFLSYFNNVDDILQYNCPEHLEKFFNDSAQESHKSKEIPDYVNPSSIHISTMTTTALLSLQHNLNLQALFYFLPCYCPLNSSPNNIEMSILNIEPEIKGKRKRKRNVAADLEKEDLNPKITRFTKAFMSSGWVIKSNNSYCPLKKFHESFCQYYTDRFNRITGNINTEVIPYDKWRDAFINSFDNNDYSCNNENIYVQKDFTNLCYPKKQQLYENALITKTEFYDPISYPDGTEFIFGCDIRNVFPTIIDNKFKGMIKGDPTVSAKKKTSKTAFDNQCTMRIANDTLESKINTKLFVNGKMQMTGCKSIEKTEKALRFLIHEIETVSYYKTLYNKVVLELKVLNQPSCDKIIDIPSEVYELIFKNIRAVDLCKLMTISNQFYSIIKSPIFWVKRIESEFNYKIRHDEKTSSLYAYEKYNTRSKIFKKLTPQIKIGNPMQFYANINNEKLYKEFVPLRRDDNVKPIEISEISVEMINSNFDVHFNIDQEKITNILKSKPYNLFVTFETHPGVNVKYIGTNDKGYEQEITILIFRTGSIIITGVKSYKLLHEAYDFINGVLKKHYYDIWQPSSK
jgi:TATA-box binding protein (TBP) (component of TFIID and TFIIIB)